MGIFPTLCVAVILCASVASLYTIFLAAKADTVSVRARWQIGGWQSGKQPFPTPREWGLARSDLTEALRWTPGDAQLYENLGYLYGLRAMAARDVNSVGAPLFEQTILYYRQAIVHRPMSPYAWANLALALHYRQADPKRLWEAYDRAYVYGNREKGVQLVLAGIGFSRWNELTPERQSSLQKMVDTAYPHARGDLVKLAVGHGLNLFESQASPNSATIKGQP